MQANHLLATGQRFLCLTLVQKQLAEITLGQGRIRIEFDGTAELFECFIEPA